MEMDWKTECQKELSDLSWKWKVQKEKLEKQKTALQDALRVKKGQVEQLEALLEECDANLDLCDSRIEMAGLIEDLVPPGTTQQKNRALKGWMRIRMILSDEKIGFKEKAEKCQKIFESYIENKESYACFEGKSNASQTSDGTTKNICLASNDIKQELDAASDALVGLMFEKDVGSDVYH